MILLCEWISHCRGAKTEADFVLASSITETRKHTQRNGLQIFCPISFNKSFCRQWTLFSRDFSASGLQINKWIRVEEQTYKRAVLCCSQERHWESFHWVNALLIPLHVDTDICIWSGSVCIGSAFEFCTSHLFCAMVKFVFKVKLSFSMVKSMSVWRNVLTTYSFCLCVRIPFLNLLSG